MTVSRRRTLRTDVAICTLASIAFLVSAVPARSQDTAKPATLQGSVRDSHHQAVAAAKVCLQVKDGKRIQTATTDADGTYRFAALKEGPYTLHAEMSGHRDAPSIPLFLRSGETKRIDLELGPLKAQPSNASTAKPEFFDEPQFTVAGVSDTTNFGGHGSDTVVRTTETLAKETVSLRREVLPASQQSPSAAAREQSLRDAVDQNPGTFDANHQLGTFLAAGGKAREALPYLEQASRLNPGDYENAYQLSSAYANLGDYQHAHQDIEGLLAHQDKAELHHLLGDVEEKQGNPVEAVREYQRAAALSPSEPNLFDWGAELLMHTAVEPAVEVFTKGNHLFPRSSRMLVGLGVAWYGRGSYDQAVRNLCQASALNPDDPTPYLFLGKLQTVDATPSKDAADKLGRFAKLQPENSLASYYYAVSLWRQRKGPDDAESSVQVESLLQKAVHLDPSLGPAFLQLGILYSERKDHANAISAFQKAIDATPRLEQAHYRLAQAYRRAGENAKAQSELRIYEQISKETAAEVVRERHDIQQFVYSLRDRSPVAQPK